MMKVMRFPAGLNVSKICFRHDVAILSRISLQLQVNQIQCMSKYSFRRKNIYANWWIDDYKRKPVPLSAVPQNKDNMTKENEEFIKEVISDKTYSPLNVEIFNREEWKYGSIRTGLIGRKIGSYPMFSKTGEMFLPTLVQIINNTVVKYIPPEELLSNDPNYKRRCPSETLGALVIGCEDADPRMFTKEYLNIFQDTGIAPKRKLSKFLITPNARLTPGTLLYATHFKPGAKLDVAGTTIYRGYQGVMKRWGFHGLGASHGVTKAHRAAGNTSGGKKDGHWKGTKLAGNMGRRFRVHRGVEILRINTKHNVLYLKGPIPGAVNSYVNLYDSLLPNYRQTEENHSSFPTFFQEEEDNIEENLYSDITHDFSNPTIRYQ